MSSTELWYITRGSGAVALVLLTVSVVLGILSALRVEGPRWPRFAIGSIHRNTTLLAIVFVALHVATTVADGYAPIGLTDAIIPFAAPYRPFWLGLGAVALDLLLALVVTSYLRHRIGARIWRGVHWLAYASWPVALLHSFGTGSDPKSTWLVALGVTCLVSVVVATLARVAVGGGIRNVRIGGAAAAVAAPILVVVWYLSGPAQTGWAARAGTPTHLMASHRITQAPAKTLTSAASPPGPFSARLVGTIVQGEVSNGTTRVVIKLRLTGGGPGGALRIDLRGTPSAGGVSMAASGVSFVPATTRTVYYGSVTGLDNNLVAATVADSAGDRLLLTMILSLDSASGTATGTVDARTGGGDGG
ncbi:MAG TPA: ferric reductase-like transmembrane domain-containing protein [Gaiellaceae bacterium]|nr:ferric reductase-like transmembrane domain-containing protein [Gaiellaceae bacterium]